MNYDQELINDLSSKRFTLTIDGHVAFIEYKLKDQLLFLIHTEVPGELEGKGVGSAIVEKTLQYAKDQQFSVVPLCPFVRKFLDKHAEWNTIIAPETDRFL